MFWLSHHHPSEFSRCYRLFDVHVCARCLGVYPVLFAALVIQFSLGAPLSHRLDVVGSAVLTVPALGDWAYGRLHPTRGNNGWRTLTGALLGVALGRTLFVHFQKPFPDSLVIQGALVVAVTVPVILLSYRRIRL
jgi:uncharacterized membrane protein